MRHERNFYRKADPLTSFQTPRRGRYSRKLWKWMDTQVMVSSAGHLQRTPNTHNSKFPVLTPPRSSNKTACRRKRLFSETILMRTLCGLGRREPMPKRKPWRRPEPEFTPHSPPVRVPASAEDARGPCGSMEQISQQFHHHRPAGWYQQRAQYRIMPERGVGAALE